MNESSQDTTLTVLHFLIQNIHACITLNCVKRVLPLPRLETVPGGPSYLIGLMNLAGTSIPVIDLSRRIGMQRIKPYPLDVPIVLCFHDSLQTGIVVDKVLGLVTIDTSALQMGTDFTKNDSPFLGVIPVDNELSLFLNIKHITAIHLTAEEEVLSIDKNLLSKIKMRHEK